MKFSKSEKQLHVRNYNPPCNVYQPDHLINQNKVLTGSLAPASILERNTFGFETRFQAEKNTYPGPGAYCQQIKVNIIRNANTDKSKLIKGNHLSLGASPSIPFNYYGQDTTDHQQQEYVKQLHLCQNISEATRQIKKKQPAFSFNKSQRNYSYIPKIKQIVKPQQPNQIDYYNQQMGNKKSNQQKKANLIWNQKIKRANQRRLQVIQSIDPEFVPSLQLIQLIKNNKNKPLPGPADYLVGQNLQPTFQFYQNPKGTSFSSVKRFSEQKESVIGPGSYHHDHLQKGHKFSFGKSYRKMFDQKDEVNYRYYINPEPANQKQNENKAKRAPSCPFGSRSTRFPQKIDSQQPALTLEEENKRKSNLSLNKIVKDKLKMHYRKSLQNQKQEGLLGISTMASTIQ